MPLVWYYPVPVQSAGVVVWSKADSDQEQGPASGVKHRVWARLGGVAARSPPAGVREWLELGSRLGLGLGLGLGLPDVRKRYELKVVGVVHVVLQQTELHVVALQGR